MPLAWAPWNKIALMLGTICTVRRSTTDGPGMASVLIPHWGSTLAVRDLQKRNRGLGRLWVWFGHGDNLGQARLGNMNFDIADWLHYSRSARKIKTAAFPRNGRARAAHH